MVTVIAEHVKKNSGLGIFLRITRPKCAKRMRLTIKPTESSAKNQRKSRGNNERRTEDNERPCGARQAVENSFGQIRTLLVERHKTNQSIGNAGEKNRGEKPGDGAAFLNDHVGRSQPEADKIGDVIQIGTVFGSPMFFCHATVEQVKQLSDNDYGNCPGKITMIGQDRDWQSRSRNSGSTKYLHTICWE